MLRFWTWSRDDWTLAIAVTALALPWLVALWKRLFRPGTIDIYESGALEVGYSGVGAAIGVGGTLRSRDHDMFIERAFLTLLAPGGEARKLEWALFRTAKTIVGQSSTSVGQVGQSGEISVEAPASFMILAVQPYRFNILFADALLLQQMRPVFQKYRQSLHAFIDRFDEPVAAAIADKPVEILRAIFDKFTQTTEYREALADVEKLFYWTPGRYGLTFNIKTDRPSRSYSETWSFTLREEDVDNLRLNFPAILHELSGLPISVGQYHFAYPIYE
jgi:hypothetical protein